LEPPGICEVKYRKPDQVATAHRLDPVLKDLDDAMTTATDDEESKRIAADIAGRENMLAPMYLQVAHEFADLHDRAGRMKAKNCIREELQWKNARPFFYWRIRRRIHEDAFKDRLMEASGGAMSLAEVNAKVQETLGGDLDDKAAAAWYEKNAAATDAAVKAVRVEYAAADVKKMLAGLSGTEKQTVLSKF
jgi:acetyl-CoA carboxylase/biotin carboxylase 1